MSDLDEMVAGVRRAVSGARLPEPARVRARGDQRTARRRVAAATAVVGGIVLVLAAALTLGPASRRPQPPAGTVTPTPTATASLATPTPGLAVLRQGSISHAVEPLSVASGHGSIWLAFRAAPVPSSGAAPGPGELVRIDTQTLTVTARWPIVGSPVALVVTERYLWVAGDIFDGRPAAQNANHVQQFDLAGKLLHTYAVDTPTAMAGQGDSVWIEYGSPAQPGYLGHLHDGIADAPLRLSGTNTIDSLRGHALVVCSDGIYAATNNDQAHSTFVDHILPGKAAAHVNVPVSGLTVLGCGPSQGVLATTPDPTATTLQQLFIDGRDSTPAVSLPGFSRALGGGDAGVWIGLTGTAGTTQIWVVDRNGLQRGDRLTIPVDVIFSTTDDRALWTVAADSQHPNTWIITAISAN